MPEIDSESTATHDRRLEHFVYGAIPASIAGIALLIQGLTSVVPYSHRGILYVIVVVGVMASTTVLLWCTSTRIKEQFEKRADAQDEILAETCRVVNRLDRSNQALHKKLDDACEERKALQVEITALKKEIGHFCELIVESEPTIGPSPYSLDAWPRAVEGTSPGPPHPRSPDRRPRVGRAA